MVSAVRAGNDPVRIGIYRHYKHTETEERYYQVIGIARHTETEEIGVIYVPLYPAGGVRMAFRPLTRFVDMVEHNGVPMRRFTFVGTEIPKYSV